MITRGAFAHSGSSSGGDEEETTNSTSLETTVPSSDNSSDENSCVATQLEVPVTHTIPAIRSTRNALLESEDEKEVAPEPPPRPPLTSRTTSPGNSLVRGGFVSISSEEMVVYSTIGATPEPQSRHPSTLRTTSPSTLSLRDGCVSISSEEMAVYSTIGATPEPPSRHPSTLRTTSPSTLSLRNGCVSISSGEIVVYSTVETATANSENEEEATPELQPRRPLTWRSTPPSTLSPRSSCVTIPSEETVVYSRIETSDGYDGYIRLPSSSPLSQTRTVITEASNNGNATHKECTRATLIRNINRRYGRARNYTSIPAILCTFSSMVFSYIRCEGNTFCKAGVLALILSFAFIFLILHIYLYYSERTEINEVKKLGGKSDESADNQ